MSRGIDRRLLVIVILLALYGLAMIYSAGQTDLIVHKSGLHQLKWKWVTQIIYLAVAAGFAAGVYRVSFRLIEWATPWLYGGSLGLLAVTLVLGSGKGDAASSKSWLSFGGIDLQPVELSKIAAVLMLARWFAARREPPTTLRGLIVPSLLMGVPAVLVVLQPDLGSAIVFGAVLFGMLFWGAVPVPAIIMLASPIVSLLLAWNTSLWSVWMVVLFVLLLYWRPFVWEGVAVYLTNSAMGVIALVIWKRMSGYKQDRIISFLDPEKYRLGKAFQAWESRIAIGSGGWFGTGFTVGPQKRSGFIPAHSTDFIFAVVGEELGLIGVLVALGLFLALLYSLVRVARNASDPFVSLVVFGVASITFTHIFENIGMSISVMPITGIPLPFFSYGGSFLVATAVGLGMVFRAAEEGRSASYVES